MTISVFNFIMGRLLAERQGSLASDDINRTALVSALIPGVPGIVVGTMFSRRLAEQTPAGNAGPSSQSSAGATAQSQAPVEDVYQKPEKGVWVPPGTAVHLHLPQGDSPVKVPDFSKAKNSEEVRKIADKEHVTIDLMHEDRFRQYPAAGKVVHTASVIDAALAATDPYAVLGYDPADFDASGRGAHGTHTTSIACGNGRAGGPTGVAPESDIVFVNLSPLETGRERLSNSVALLEAVDFVARTAGERPWVINLSMGNQAGQHDGLTLVERALDNCVTAAPGRVCVQSAGNYYNRGGHAAGVVRPGERETITFTAPARLTAPCEIDVWFSGRDRMSCELVAPDGAVVRAGPGGSARLETNGRKLAAIYNRLSDPNNADNLIRIYLYQEAPDGTWRIVLCAEDIVDGRYHMWVERGREGPARQPRVEEGCIAPASTTNTICNGFRTIAVGAYDPHIDGCPLAPFSSSGPTRDGRQKPDLIAPGVRILAARSAPPGSPRSESSALTRMSGTSMAAPLVAGACALMLHAAGRPLDNRTLRALLFGSARPASQHDPQRVGSGYLDIAAAERAARDAGRAPGPSNRKELAMIDDRSFSDSLVEATDFDVDPPRGQADEPAGLRISQVTLWADALIERGMRGPDALLSTLFQLAGLSGALTPFRGGEALSAGLMFDVLAAGEGALQRYLRRFLAVVARPGGLVEPGSLCAGDLLVRRDDATNGGARLAVLAGEDVLRRSELPSYGLTAVDLRDGYYVHVADLARSFTSRTRRGWYLAGTDGRVPPDLMVLRIRTPGTILEGLESSDPSISVFVVVDDHALIRSAPPEVTSLGRTIPKGSEVRVVSSQTIGGKRYVEVMQHLPDDVTGPPRYWGWTARSNVRPRRIPLTEVIAQKYDSFIREASKAYGVPVEHIRAIMAVESGGDPNISNGSAYGLMQVVKKTWTEMRARYPELKDYDFHTYWREPRINILFGTAVLKTKVEALGVTLDHPRSGALAIAAYNAGEGTIRSAIANARAAGSEDPATDCFKPEYLKPAIAKYPEVYNFYLSGHGKDRNQTGSKDEAVDLKFREISPYPGKVQRYLDEQRNRSGLAVY